MKLSWEIIHADSLEWLVQKPSNFIDLTVTSPPYNLGIQYGEQTGNAYNDAVAYNSYIQWVRKWAYELHLATKLTGRAAINIALDTNRAGKRATYADYIRAFLEVGWRYQTTIVWNEQNISRRTAWGSWASASAPHVIAPVEMIPIFYKGEWKRAQPHGPSTITPQQFKEWTLGHWTFAGENPKRVGHPAPFPEELAKRLILLYSFQGDMVFDPFVGSGTTVKVAFEHGRSAIGIEKQPEYVVRAKERMVPGGPLPSVDPTVQEIDRVFIKAAVRRLRQENNDDPPTPYATSAL